MLVRTNFMLCVLICLFNIGHSVETMAQPQWRHLGYRWGGSCRPQGFM